MNTGKNLSELLYAQTWIDESGKLVTATFPQNSSLYSNLDNWVRFMYRDNNRQSNSDEQLGVLKDDNTFIPLFNFVGLNTEIAKEYYQVNNHLSYLEAAERGYRYDEASETRKALATLTTVINQRVKELI